MRQFVYRCPNTGHHVDGWSTADVADDKHTYESITCIACSQNHLINPTTGKVLSGPKQ